MVREEIKKESVCDGLCATCIHGDAVITFDIYVCFLKNRVIDYRPAVST